MKIAINYDLLSKVSEANHGFSIQKSTKKLLESALLAGTISSVCGLIYKAPVEEIVKDSLQLTLLYAFMHSAAQLATKKITKIIAIDTLKELSQQLQDLKVNTDVPLLLQSYKYETKYKLNNQNTIIPKIEQMKYIIVPVYENGKTKQISLMQEHFIGDDEYYLSVKDPDKVLKLVFNV